MNNTLEHKSQTANQRAQQHESQSAKAYPSRTIVHAKLEMTEPGDHDEREADAMARAIVSGGKIARKISGGSSSSSGIAVSQQMESQLSQLQGGGRPMPEGLRNMMESGFGQDFSQVRLHTDSEAANMSSSIHAKAFTLGNDIYFNHGQFSPETTEGQRLVAHELTHVVQGTGKVGREVYDLSMLTPEQRQDRMRRSKVRQDLTYCQLRADGLIEAVKEQEESEDSIFDIGWWAKNRDDEFDADFLIATLNEAKTKLKDLEKGLDTSNSDIEEINKGVQAILSIIRMVDDALAVHRNNNIEGAGDMITALRVTKTACFAIAGAAAAAALAPVMAPIALSAGITTGSTLGAGFATAGFVAAGVVAPNMAIGAVSGSIDALATEAGKHGSNFSEYEWSNVGKSAAIGGVTGGLGTTSAAIAGGIIKDSIVGGLISGGAEYYFGEGAGELHEMGYSDMYRRYKKSYDNYGSARIDERLKRFQEYIVRAEHTGYIFYENGEFHNPTIPYKWSVYENQRKIDGLKVDIANNKILISEDLQPLTDALNSFKYYGIVINEQSLPDIFIKNRQTYGKYK